MCISKHLCKTSLGDRLAVSLRPQYTHAKLLRTGVSVVDVAGCCSDCGRVSSAGGATGAGTGGGTGGGVWLEAWLCSVSPLVT